MPKVGQVSSEGLPSPPTHFLRPISLGSCQGLILEHHYSHRLPSAVKLCFGDVVYSPERQTLACCTFSLATGRWPEEVWELTRLVRLPDYDRPLTALIGKALGHIRKHKLIDLVLSFADAEEDHHGGIYQACSWLYSGMRGDRLDGFNIDGQFVPARTCNAIHGTSSEVDIANLLNGKTVEPHYDDGKHLYWKAISKDGMKKAIRLGLDSRSYPKPMIQSSTVNNNTLLPGHLRKGLVELPQAYERDGSVDERERGYEASRRAFEMLGGGSRGKKKETPLPPPVEVESKRVLKIVNGKLTWCVVLPPSP